MAKGNEVKKEIAHKSGKYGEAKTKLAGHPETKTGSPIAGASAANTLYPKKLGLRGKPMDE